MGENYKILWVVQTIMKNKHKGSNKSGEVRRTNVTYRQNQKMSRRRGNTQNSRKKRTKQRKRIRAYLLFDKPISRSLFIVGHFERIQVPRYSTRYGERQIECPFWGKGLKGRKWRQRLIIQRCILRFHVEPENSESGFRRKILFSSHFRSSPSSFG